MNDSYIDLNVELERFFRLHYIVMLKLQCNVYNQSPSQHRVQNFNMVMKMKHDKFPKSGGKSKFSFSFP